MQNMKVDIIYYEIPADFEMEFNLSGCCPMRLLKTLTYNKREYIEGLARAVSRSKIIIACGSIYGEEGLIKITSKAIHRQTEIINNAEYGIAQDFNVEIIEGSVPLVTTSGLFGGIIIESGPQTIIILSENKDIRKNVMKNLIHAYVRDISVLEIRKNSGFSALSGAPAENSNTDSEEDLTPEDIENLPETGETIDFAEEGNAHLPETDFSAPSDAALEEVAKEINDLSSEIGKTLYANDNTDNQDNKDASENYEIEISEESFNEKDEPSSEEKTENNTPDKKPQIDFEIDKEETKAAENTVSSVSVDDFIFDEKSDSAKTGFEISHPEESENNTNIFETDEDLDYAYVLTPDEDDWSAKHKSLLRAIFIIIGLLAVILLILGYFLIYVPYENGVAPLDYLKSFIPAKTIFTIWRG